MIIWDRKIDPPNHFRSEKIILWNSYAENFSKTAISIPKLIENKPKKFRDLFLKWIHDAGEAEIDGKKVIDHFELVPGFSYWWMTLIAQKCNYSISPLISDAVKIIALEDLLKKQKIDEIHLFSEKKPLIISLKKWSKINKIRLKINWNYQKKQKNFLRRIYHSLPYQVQALLWLLKIIFECYLFIGKDIIHWKSSNAKITFISYLFNIPDKIKKNQHHESLYWKDLSLFLKIQKVDTNWLHFYINDGQTSSPKKVNQYISKLNSFDNFQKHINIYSFLSLRVIFKTIIQWLRVQKVNYLIKEKLLNSTNRVYLWLLLSNDWKKSINSQIALSNLLTYNLFKAALEEMPTQNKGFYVQENQAWEYGLIHNWKNKHKLLYGFPHSTVKFWDLRYFNDQNVLIKKYKNSIPMPDSILCNGPHALNLYTSQGYPKKELIKVESLRYLYLNKLSRPKPNKKALTKCNLLLVGDFLANNTLKQLDTLKKSLPLIKIKNLKITFKPHPACNINLDNYSSLKMKITYEDLKKILPYNDFIYTSSTTSAAVDAYYAGLIVISYLDGEELNLNPLRGYKNFFYCENEIMLSSLLNDYIKIYKNKIKINKNAYFYINNDLDCWKKLLFNKR